MTDLALLATIALWIAAAVETTRVLRGGGSPPLAIAVAALAAGRTLDLDVVGEAWGRAAYLGVIEHAVTLVSALGVLVFTGVIASAGDRRISRVQDAATDPRVWILLAAAIAVPLINPTQVLPSTAEERAAVYASDPLWGIHWMAFLAVLVLVLWHGSGIALRNARHATGVLRVQLVGLGLGQTIGVVYGVLKGFHLMLLAVAPEAGTEALSLAEQSALMLCIVGIAVGMLTGAVGGAVASARTRMRVWTLWPLWRDLWENAPHLSFADTPGRLRATFARDAEFIVVRQVVELADARRSLGPQMPEHDPADHAAHARALATAAARQSAGLPPLRQSGAGTTHQTHIEALMPVARHWCPATMRRLREEFRPVG